VSAKNEAETDSRQLFALIHKDKPRFESGALIATLRIAWGSIFAC
jgi:hypothetical protein